MKKARASRAFIVATLAACGAQAQVDTGWELSGSNSAHAEYYRTHGDPNAGPYLDVGGQYFDDVAFEFVRKFSTYDVVRGQFRGVANDSISRASDRGFIPERVNVVREKGDGAIPYRAEAGDLFASFSLRTLQASLKGGQIDLQPLPFENGARSSIILVTGTSQSSWRHLHGHDNWTTGASWLYETALSHLSANAVHTFRQANTQFGTPMRQQVIGSVAGDTSWDKPTYKFKLEGEVAGLHGDHEGFADATGAIDPASGRDRRGVSVFAQVSGASVPDLYDYRLRFERNDRDFRPSQASVSADHRSEEAFAGWRLGEGRALTGKLQEVIDGMETGNELKTRTVGAKLEGPSALWYIEAYRQALTKRDASVDSEEWNLTAYLEGRISPTWTGNMTLTLQDQRDRVPGAFDTRSTQLVLNASREWSLHGWSGRIAPTLTLRRVTGGPEAVKAVYPGLTMTLNRAPHAFSAGYTYQRLRPDATSVATVEVNQLQVAYTYTLPQDTFGVELLAYDRNVTIGQYNDTYRAAVYWTHTFGASAASAARIIPAGAYDPGAALPRGLSLLLALAPGADIDIAMARLEGAGYRAIAQGGTRAFATRVIDDLDNRQRLVVEGGAGRVARVGVIIDVTDANDANSVAQTYERVRKALLDRFGSPSTSYDQGALGPTFVADLNAGRVVRAMEWRTAQGTLRLGIPRRMDGLVRIELQHGASFPAARDGRWSFEEVR